MLIRSRTLPGLILATLLVSAWTPTAGDQTPQPAGGGESQGPALAVDPQDVPATEQAAVLSAPETDPVTEFREHLDRNRKTLDPIEGIWTVTFGGTWYHVRRGIPIPGGSGDLFDLRAAMDPSRRGGFASWPPPTATLAIAPDTTDSGYDFVATVLRGPDLPGRALARFRKTVSQSVYEGLWCGAGLGRGDFVMSESRRLTCTYEDREGANPVTRFQTDGLVKHNLEVILQKTYPLD